MKRFLSGLALASVLLAPVAARSDSWEEKPHLTGRRSHAVASIGDGTVVLFGGTVVPGVNPPQVDGATWLYDPGTASWSMATPAVRPSGRAQHAMAPIGGDRVLLFGGVTSSGARNAETWLYDVGDGAWTRLAPPSRPSARSGHGMAYVGDDKVLLYGGSTGPLTSTETWVYDLSEGNWTLLSSAPPPTPPGGSIVAPLLTQIGVGRALLYSQDLAWLFDLATGEWALSMSPPPSPGRALAYVSEDQAILYAAPSDAVGPGLAWLFDASDDAWTLVSATGPPTRTGAGFAVAGGDRLVLVGGMYGNNSLSRETWLFDLSDASWQQQAMPALPSPRSAHPLVPLGGGRALMFGGVTGTGANGETWIYDAAADTWEQGLSPAPSPRGTHAMAPAGDGVVVLFGGVDALSAFQGDTWVYRAATGEWSLRTPPLSPSARAGHAMAYAGGDRVVLFGGRNADPSTPFGDTWVYDVSDDAWTLVTPGTSPPGRFGGAMTWIAGDQVLLFGGMGPPVPASSSLLGDTWVYDAGDASWTPKPSTTSPSARYGHSLSPLGSGNALLFAGGAPTDSADSWIYSLGEDTWTLQGPSPAPGRRTYQAAAGLGDGRVVMFAGYRYVAFFTGSKYQDTWVYTHVSAANAPPVLDPVGDRRVAWGVPLSFAVTASDPDGGSLTFSLDPGAPAGASIDPVTGAFLWTPSAADVGTHSVTIRVADSGVPPLDGFETISIGASRRPGVFAYEGETSGTCTETVLLAGTLVDGLNGEGLPAKRVGFTLGSQAVSALTGELGAAAAKVRLAGAAGVRDLLSGFDGDAAYSLALDADAFTVLPESSVGAAYAGDHLVVACAGCGFAAARLSASVWDVDDGSRGDVRDASTSFVSRRAGGETLCSGSVTLLDPADPTAGSASCATTFATGIHQVGIAIGGCYTRGNPEEDALVTVTGPGDSTVSGGGYLVPTAPGGTHPSDPGSRTDLALLVTYSKTGKSPTGAVRVLVRSGGRVFRVGAGAIKAFKVKVRSSGGEATLAAPALIEDITDPAAPVVVEAFGSLEVSLVDRGEPGVADTVGITVLDRAGQPWFQSHVEKRETEERPLSAGDLRVR